MAKEIDWYGELPPCDVCLDPAPWDSPSRQGPWGNFCDRHMDTFGQKGMKDPASKLAFHRNLKMEEEDGTKIAHPR